MGDLYKSALARMNEELCQERDDALAARDKALERLAQAEHRACRIKDAVDELRKGVFLGDCETSRFELDPNGGYRLVSPERVVGIYEALKAKLEEIGDWSRLQNAEKMVYRLRKAIRAYVQSQAFQGICDEECDLEKALQDSYY